MSSINSDKNCRIHHRLVEELADRLSKKGYDDLDIEVPYQRPGDVSPRGEMDVVAMRYRNGITYLHYYEVKCHDGPKTSRKARVQLQHFNEHFGHLRGVVTKFIYVTPERIERWKR